MTPEELMIGDIVNVHRCECVADGGHFQEWDEYGKVVSITEYYITIKYIGREEDYGFEDVNGEDINPIPLTDEIMEKNFPIYEKGYTVGWWTDEFGNAGPFWFELTANGVHIEIKYIKYVHELQHALRLCNILKEIEI